MPKTTGRRSNSQGSQEEKAKSPPCRGSAGAPHGTTSHAGWREGGGGAPPAPKRDAPTITNFVRGDPPKRMLCLYPSLVTLDSSSWTVVIY